MLLSLYLRWMAVKGRTMAEATVEGLQAELKAAQTALDEASKGQMSKEDRDRLTFLEGDNKTLIEARDKAKKERDNAETARLTEQGEFKTLSEQLQVKVDSLSGDITKRDETLAGYQERDKKELDALLPNVPEALRAEVSDESLPLAKRLTLARALAGTKTKVPGYKEPGEPGSNSITRQAFDALSPADKSKHISDGGKIHD
jgi:hypothetical protein